MASSEVIGRHQEVRISISKQFRIEDQMEGIKKLEFLNSQ